MARDLGRVGAVVVGLRPGQLVGGEAGGVDADEQVGRGWGGWVGGGGGGRSGEGVGAGEGDGGGGWGAEDLDCVHDALGWGCGGDW